MKGKLIGGTIALGLGAVFCTIPYAHSNDKINTINNLTHNNGSCCSHSAFVAGSLTNDYYTVENGSCAKDDETLNCTDSIKDSIRDKKNSIIAMGVLGGLSGSCLVGALISHMVE